MDEWTDGEGNSLGDWQEITREEYDRLFGGADLTVFSSLTDPEGTFGIRQVYTAWGRHGEDAPLIDIRDYKGEDGRTERQVCRKFVPVSGPPSVDPAVLDRAEEEARTACRGTAPDGLPSMRLDPSLIVRTAAPIVAAAAYRQGREDGLREAREFYDARIEGAAKAFDELADMPGVAKTLRSLLTDTGSGAQ